MNTVRVIAVVVVMSILGTPAFSFAKAVGGYRGGRGSSGSGTMASGNMGSRGARTHDDNGYGSMQRSTTPAPAPTQTQPMGRPAASPTSAGPVAQPSFLQRHPIFTGLAAGIAGSWIGHMLFGASSTEARTADGIEKAPQGDGENSSGGFGSMGMVLVFMALAAGAWYYLFRVRRTAHVAAAFPGPGAGRNSGLGAGTAFAATCPSGVGSAPSLTQADEDEFRRSLVEIQTGWGKQDLTSLRRLTTPEMYQYFNDLLSENTSGCVINHIEDVAVLEIQVREVWAEQSRVYATVVLRWAARDYTVSLDKRQGDSGYLIEGDERTQREATEVWTFMKHEQGKWLLSAIQQIV